MGPFKRPIAVIIMTVFAATLLGGCSVNEKMSLLAAFEKTSQITSSETQSEITLDFDISGASRDYQDIISGLEPMLSDIKIVSHQLTSKSSDKTKLNSKIDMSISSSGLSQDTTMWSKVDDVNATQIIKLPDIVSSQLPPELSDKQYMVLDQNDLSGLTPLGSGGYGDMAKTATDMQSKLIAFLKNYAVQYDPQFAYVTYKGKSTIKGVPAEVYEIRLTNESLKSLISHALYDMADNESVKNSVKELVYSIIAVGGAAEAVQDLDLTFDKLRDGSSSFSEDIGKIRKAFRDVDILGEKGLVVDLAIDDSGYLINQKGVADFVLNTYAVDKAMEKLYAGEGTVLDGGSAGMDLVMELTMNFDTYVYNINRDITIEYPELTAENSFNFSQLMAAVPSISKIPAGAIKEVISGKQKSSLYTAGIKQYKAVKTELVPVEIGGKLLVPLKPICKEVGAKVTGSKNGTTQVTNGDIKLSFANGSSMINVAGKSVDMILPAVPYENDLLIPAEALTKYLKCGIEYDRKLNKLKIGN